MRVNHLTEDQLQLVALGVERIDNSIQDHLNVCDKCQSQLVMYQQIYQSLASADQFHLTKSVRQDIMKKVQVLESSSNIHKRSWTYFIGLSLASVLVMLSSLQLAIGDIRTVLFAFPVLLIIIPAILLFLIALAQSVTSHTEKIKRIQYFEPTATF